MRKSDRDNFLGNVVAGLMMTLLIVLILGVAAVAWQQHTSRPQRFTVVAIDGPAESQALIVDQRDGHVYEWRRMADNPAGVKTVVIYQGAIHPVNVAGQTVLWTNDHGR